MPHTKHIWVDENVQFPNRYLVDGVYKTITRDVGTVIAQDPISASKLNAIENSLTEVIGAYAVNLYVNGTTGNDANDGLSAGTALKTIMAAVNKLPIVVYQNVNINIADGTYNEAVEVIGRVGSGIITLTGNATTIGAVKVVSINSNRNSCYTAFSGFEATTVSAVGFNSGTDKHTLFDKCKCVGLSANAGFLVANGKARFQNCESSNRSSGIFAYYGGEAIIITCSGDSNSVGVLASVGGIARITDSSPNATNNAANKYAQDTGGQIFKPNGVMKFDGWRIYSSLAELGLSGTPTVEQIVNAMPAKAIANIRMIGNPNMPDQYITLHIETAEAIDSVKITAHKFYPQTELKVWEYNYALGGVGSSGWKEEYHSGNYDVDKPIYGNYTITDADHGKNLVQCQFDAVNYIWTVPNGNTVRKGFKCTITERIAGSGKTTLAASSGSAIYSNPDNSKRSLNGIAAIATLSRFFEGADWYLAGNLKV